MIKHKNINYNRDKMSKNFKIYKIWSNKEFNIINWFFKKSTNFSNNY